ncbi:MAG: hypothetical protein Q8936_19820 [Bacillota bacterium]|nr:hypothetical protein [Bacillota bacterium]
MANPVLLVPIQVKAMVVNKNLLNEQPYRRWEEAYNMLNRFSSAEPDFSSEGGGFVGDGNTGVYLHWMLPDALRHGVQDMTTGNLEFPLVPNRWLVVRFSGMGKSPRLAKAFLIESDAPGDSSSSMYIFDPAVVKELQNCKDEKRKNYGDQLSKRNDTILNGLLGQVFDLNGWTEVGMEKLFVTAVAPGNTVFSGYQPHCKNVFSFHDKLDSSLVNASDTLSYMVAGWYSNTSEDPVNSCINNNKDNQILEAYQSMLNYNKWALDKDSSNIIPSASLYHGMVFSVKWEQEGVYTTVADKYENDIGKGLRVAVGNSSIDCFKAIVDVQLKEMAQGGNQQAIDILQKCSYIPTLIEAFQYDMLDTLDKPNGQQLLDYRIRQEWFGSKPGGYRWVIVDSDTNTSNKVKTAEEIKAQEAKESWLGQLNEDQAALDKALAELHDYQWQLYAMWWKNGKFGKLSSFIKDNMQGVTQQQFTDALSLNNPNSLPSKIHELMKTIQGVLAVKVPTPIYKDGAAPEAAMAAGIQDFEDKMRSQGKLDLNRSLKQVAEQRFWKPNDPVVMITGAGSQEQMAQQDETLACRLSTNIVSGFKFNNLEIGVNEAKKTMPVLGFEQEQLAEQLKGNYIPEDTASQIAGAIQALLYEFYFLDPDNAKDMADMYAALNSELVAKYDPSIFMGILPAIIPKAWEQPWTPMFLKWVGRWYPIDYLDPEKNRNWSFDGVQYRYNGNNPTPKPQSIGGEILLTPQTSYIFKNRLKQFVKVNSSTYSQLIDGMDGFIDAVDDWDIISQSLSGFTDVLTLRNNKTNITPGSEQPLCFKDGAKQTMAELIGKQAGNAPLIRSYGTGDQVDLGFYPVRQGQLFIEYMAIYDNFGQLLQIIGGNDSGVISADSFPLIIAEGLKPDSSIMGDIERPMVQLPTALAQHSRLNFKLVDALTGSKYIDIYQDEDPVAGWLLPNHLDSSISLYDPQGAALGELALLQGQNNNKYVDWIPSPGSSINSIDAVAKVSPSVADFITKLQGKGAQAMEDFMEVIDSSLWTVDPIGGRSDENLTVLFGRPLALVRAKINLELDGVPIEDPSWQNTFSPKVHEFTQYDFEIRLGDEITRQDGLIGYYEEQAYDSFNSVYQLEKASEEDGYINHIAPGNFLKLKFDGKTSADVMMLVDPRASIHAFTGITPMQNLSVPAKFVDKVIGSLKVNFQCGPLLTQQIQWQDNEKSNDEEIDSFITMPIPAEKNGNWQWLENQYQSGKNSWKSYGLSQASCKALLSDNPWSLREGWLSFLDKEIN